MRSKVVDWTSKKQRKGARKDHSSRNRKKKKGAELEEKKTTRIKEKN